MHQEFSAKKCKGIQQWLPSLDRMIVCSVSAPSLLKPIDEIKVLLKLSWTSVSWIQISPLKITANRKDMIEIRLMPDLTYSNVA